MSDLIKSHMYVYRTFSCALLLLCFAFQRPDRRLFFDCTVLLVFVGRFALFCVSIIFRCVSQQFADVLVVKVATDMCNCLSAMC